MATNRGKPEPRHFFLNESHELATEDRAGGGSVPKYVDIPWAQKAKKLNASFDRALQTTEGSKDPLREKRYFVVANPVAELKKSSTDKKKAPDGTFGEKPSFGGTHGRIFDRLGLDLLQVTPEGKAVVHGEHERIMQLLERSRSLQDLGKREQARWIAIEDFEAVPFELRVDNEWLASLRQDRPADVVFELQPVLTRIDADSVLRAISDLLRKTGERLVGTGSDFFRPFLAKRESDSEFDPRDR